jgi:hypothetical protein
MKIIFHRLTMSAIVLGVLMFFSYSVYAENIDPLNDGSQYAYGENIGWLNFEPSLGPGVTVTTSQLTGYVWAENIGWINLSPTNYGGVFNDGTGNLGGYAWGENVGWINFSPTYGGVTIDTDGNFNGWAWGENIGWIHFNSQSPVAYKVQTGVYSISGTVTGAIQEGITIGLTGSSEGIAVTDSSGNYSFSGLGNGTYTIIPWKFGYISAYTFNPPSGQVIIAGADVMGVNFVTSIGQFQINISANASCEWQDTFRGGDTVYGKATLGLSPNTSYPLYVVDDASYWWADPDLSLLCRQCATTPESTFTTDSSGNMPCGTIIWQNLQTTGSSASFDIIIDVDGDGMFEFDTEFIDSMFVTGFTLVQLSSFEAIPESGKVTLKWVTESEIDNAGFNIYRAEAEDGEYVKINTSLIPAEGSPTQGASYQYVDENVKNRTTYYYKLEDIDLNGNSTMHGPVSAVPRRIGRD